MTCWRQRQRRRSSQNLHKTLPKQVSEMSKKFLKALLHLLRKHKLGRLLRRFVDTYVLPIDEPGIFLPPAFYMFSVVPSFQVVV